uniref:Uncharacterized protein n=1 Tax=Cannabis sativa TaxID=3483 RepID=A0A803NHI6_CANSA
MRIGNNKIVFLFHGSCLPRREDLGENGGLSHVYLRSEHFYENYTTLNRANIGQYRTLLRNVKMQGSLGYYLLKIKRLVDLLASIGHHINHVEPIEAIFNGLRSDYNVFIISINSRTNEYFVAEIKDLLMAQEVRLEKATAPPLSRGPGSQSGHVSAQHPPPGFPTLSHRRGSPSI